MSLPRLRRRAISQPPLHRRKFWLLPILILAAFFLGSCVGGSRAADGQSIDFLIESAPTNLDPRVGIDVQSQHLDDLIFSSLVSHDAHMNPLPDLALQWETSDPLTYVFHLRSNVHFHDGRPLDSQDVKYTFDSILSGAIRTPKRGSFRLLQSVAAPDPSTVVFHLRQPYASFLSDITRPAIGIVPRGAGTEISQHPIGSGPFRFASDIADQEIILERNADYFGAPARLARVRFRIVPDATVRALELRKGSADIALNSLSPDMIAPLARQPQIAVSQQPGSTIAYMVFNFDDPLLRRRAVRQAIAYATDRVTLIRYLLRGQARLADSLLPPNQWAYSGEVTHYPYDPAQAQQLLDSAGLSPGRDGIRFHVTLKTSTEESSRLLAEALQEQWRRVGIALDLRSLEFATFFSDLTHGAFQLALAHWIGANSDPDIFEFVFSSGKIPPNGANRGRYRNPVLDALLDQVRVEMDVARRRRLLASVQQIVAADLPYLDLWYPDNICVYRRRVSDVHLDPAGDYTFLNFVSLH